MKVYNYHMSEYKNLRDKFTDTVDKVFNSSINFIEFIENGIYDNTRYDVFTDSGDECYIINRDSGEYVNWYKFYHLGRDIHMNFNPDDLEKFITDFKGD